MEGSGEMEKLRSLTAKEAREGMRIAAAARKKGEEDLKLKTFMKHIRQQVESNSTVPQRLNEAVNQVLGSAAFGELLDREFSKREEEEAAAKEAAELAAQKEEEDDDDEDEEQEEEEEEESAESSSADDDDEHDGGGARVRGAGGTAAAGGGDEEESASSSEEEGGARVRGNASASSAGGNAAPRLPESQTSAGTVARPPNIFRTFVHSIYLAHRSSVLPRRREKHRVDDVDDAVSASDVSFLH